MAKLDSLFKYSGTLQGVTMVRSRAYGHHLRKARTSCPLSEGMKDSGKKLGSANLYAKAIKDAVDPYRSDFLDGQLWQRLVSYFKKQLQKERPVEYIGLEGHELNTIHPFSRIMHTKAEVSQSDGMLNVRTTSIPVRDTTRGQADSYEQTLIILFVDSQLNVQTDSESVMISLGQKRGKQEVTWAIPPKATTAILIIKCNFASNSKPLDFRKAMGMTVAKVVRLE